jgi:hypothetical protein
MQLGVARSVTGDIQADTQALLHMLALAGPHVRWTPAYQRTTIAGRQGLTTVLQNVSPVTGRFEQVFLATAPLPDGNLLYLLGIAPLEESSTYRKAFDRVRESVQMVN